MTNSHLTWILALVHFFVSSRLLHWVIVSVSPMGCLYCRKNIGPLRRLRDQHFCCEEHRKKYTSSLPARCAKPKIYMDLRVAPATWRVVYAVQPEDKSDRKAGMGTSIFVGLTVIVLVLALSRNCR